MIIRTNVKAGTSDGRSYVTNHNEKLTIDSDNSIEQKKACSKKLRLDKETVRILKDGDLKRVAGGAKPTATCTDFSLCFCE